MSDVVRYEVRNRKAYLTLNRPDRLNAITTGVARPRPLVRCHRATAHRLRKDPAGTRASTAAPARISDFRMIPPGSLSGQRLHLASRPTRPWAVTMTWRCAARAALRDEFASRLPSYPVCHTHR